MFRAAVGRLLGSKRDGAEGRSANGGDNQQRGDDDEASASKGKKLPPTSLVKDKPVGVAISPPLPPPKAPKPEVATGLPPRAPVIANKDVPQLEVADSRLPLRSVKISFAKGTLTQEDVEKAASSFGEVSHVGKRGDKCFVVLFARVTDAIQCSTDLARFLPPISAALESKLRIKYMGGGGLDDSYSSLASDLSMSVLLPGETPDADVSRLSLPAIVAEPLHIQAVASSDDAEADAFKTRAYDLECVLTLDEFSLNQTLLQQSLLLEENEAAVVVAAADGEAHGAKLVHSESNISLQSEAVSLLSRAPSQLFGAEDDDYAVGREEGAWKTAYAAPANLQIPHYSQQPTQTQSSRMLDFSLDDAEVPVQPAVSLSTKKPIQVQVGSPKSSSEPGSDEPAEWEDVAFKSERNSRQGVLEAGDLLEDDADSLPNTIDDAYDDDIDDEDESEVEKEVGAGPAIATMMVTRVNEADDIKMVAKPPKPAQSVLIKVPAVSLPVRPSKVVDDNADASQASAPQNIAASSPVIDTLSLQKKFNEVLAKVRLLEAEAKVRNRERSDLEREMQACEENWEAELTELELRNAKLENECNALKESNRRARIEAARTAGELSAALVAKNAAESLLEGASAKAESDALAAVLSHQRLIGILDKQKDAALCSLAQHREELSLLRGQHKAAVADSLEWKARALHAEAKLKSLGAGERPAMLAAIGNVSGCVGSNEEVDDDRVVESKADGEETREDDGQKGDDALMEVSSRYAVQQEVAKYLALVNAGEKCENRFDRYHFSTTYSLSGLAMTERRTRNVSEKIAIDLAESRRKLDALRSTSIR